MLMKKRPPRVKQGGLEIECQGFRPWPQNLQVGYADFLVSAWGLEIKDCPVLTEGMGLWVDLPARACQGVPELFHVGDRLRFRSEAGRALIRFIKEKGGAVASPANDSKNRGTPLTLGMKGETS